MRVYILYLLYLRMRVYILYLRMRVVYTVFTVIYTVNIVEGSYGSIYLFEYALSKLFVFVCFYCVAHKYFAHNGFALI